MHNTPNENKTSLISYTTSGFDNGTFTERNNNFNTVDYTLNRELTTQTIIPHPLYYSNTQLLSTSTGNSSTGNSNSYIVNDIDNMNNMNSGICSRFCREYGSIIGYSSFFLVIIILTGCIIIRLT